MPSRLLGPPRRPDPPPLQTNDAVVVAVGTALWAVGLLVLGVLRLTGTTQVPDWWLVMCLAGIALGLVGLRVCARRQAAARAAGAPRPRARRSPQA